MLGAIAFIVSVIALAIIIMMSFIVSSKIRKIEENVQRHTEDVKSRIGRLVNDINGALRSNYQVDSSQHRALASR